MAESTPAFQYYPADLISDPKVMFWDMEAVGCYWQLITYLWLNGGKFEFNLENLAVLFRVKRKLKAEKLWLKISNKFVLEDGIVTHKRVMKEMQKQSESRVRRIEAGKKGADIRWRNDSNANGNAIGLPMAKNSPSTSNSNSTSKYISTKEKLPRELALEIQKEGLRLQGIIEKRLGPLLPKEHKTFMGVVRHLIDYARKEASANCLTDAISLIGEKIDYCVRNEKSISEAKPLFVASIKKKYAYNTK